MNTLLKFASFYLPLWAGSALGNNHALIGEQSGLKIRPADVGAYHGAFLATPNNPNDIQDLMNRIDVFERVAQKRLQVVTIQGTWENGLIFPLAATRAIYESGRIPIVRIQPISSPRQNTETKDAIYDLRDIALGKFDAAIKSMWQQVAALTTADGRRVALMIIFGPEVNGEWNRYSGIHYGGGWSQAWGDPNYPDGPEIFRDAYRRLIDLARSDDVKADNITWATHFNLRGSPRDVGWNVMKNYYPGDEYIDWIGLSVFGAQIAADLRWYDSFQSLVHRGSIGWQEFLQVSDSAHKAFFEFGVIEHPNRPNAKADWLKAALAFIPNEHPEIKLASYWHEDVAAPNSISNFRIDSSQAAGLSYRSAINSAFYNATVSLDGHQGDVNVSPAAIPAQGFAFPCGAPIYSIATSQGAEQVSLTIATDSDVIIYQVDAEGRTQEAGGSSIGHSFLASTNAGTVFAIYQRGSCLQKIMTGRGENLFNLTESRFEPQCTPAGIEKPEFAMTYISSDLPGWGYMDLTRGEGFSCIIDPSVTPDLMYPQCNLTCPDLAQDQPIQGYGWCKSTSKSGFSCRD